MSDDDKSPGRSGDRPRSRPHRGKPDGPRGERRHGGKTREGRGAGDQAPRGDGGRKAWAKRDSDANGGKRPWKRRDDQASDKRPADGKPWSGKPRSGKPWRGKSGNGGDRTAATGATGERAGGASERSQQPWRGRSHRGGDAATRRPDEKRGRAGPRKGRTGDRPDRPEQKIAADETDAVRSSPHPQTGQRRESWRGLRDAPKPWHRADKRNGAARGKSKTRAAGAGGDKRGGRSGQRTETRETPKGFEARAEALAQLLGVLMRRIALDDVIAEAERGLRSTPAGTRDRAFARMMAATVLRRLGQIDDVLGQFLERPLPADQAEVRAILQLGAAQLLFLGTPPHAAINIAVEQVRRSPNGRKLDGLVNAILRRVSSEGAAIVARHGEGGAATRLNSPDWMLARWTRAYGEARALAIADASLREAPLDLSVKSDAAGWAQKLGGVVLPTGTVRLDSRGRIEDLPGFADGEWWVQDAAAALPGRLLGDVAGKAVADLCAAPGGKTMALAAAGAKVTAVDWSEDRLGRLKQNLTRLKLTAETVSADAANWMPPTLFDAVLLDAPCTATGTIRRHPDIMRLKRESDVVKLADVQTRLLTSAVRLVRPGGLIVFCTCSLEPEEGEELIGRFLAGTQMVEAVPATPADVFGMSELIGPKGYLRTFPDQMSIPPPGISGMDGFFAARLRRKE